MRLFILLFIFFNFNIGNAQQICNKIALLIGVGQYEDPAWLSLSSANDLELIAPLLKKQGFQSVTIIKDKQATQKRIEDAIKALIDNSKPGDFVYFHFSGHGQQTYDKAPDLDEEDGYDEAIVPYDAPMIFKDDVVDNEKHIRDDYLQKQFAILRKKLGHKGRLLVVIDACHSGSSTRNGNNQAIVRGVSRPYQPPGYTAGKDINPREVFETVNQDTSLAPITAFFASGPAELNFETKIDSVGYGSLTYAFVIALGQCSISNTYQFVYDQIRDIMAKNAPCQMPQYEGELGMQVLNGMLVPKKNYWLVSKKEGVDAVLIKAGKLDGIDVNSIVAFYPPDADTSKTNPLNTGVVIQSNFREALVHLYGPPHSSLLNSWVFIKKETYPFKLTVRVTQEINEKQRNIISNLGFVTLISEQAEVTVSYNKKADSIIFTNLYGYITGSVSLLEQDSLPVKIKMILLKTAKAQFLRKLSQKSNVDLASGLSIIPFSYSKRDTLYNGKAKTIYKTLNPLPDSLIKDGSGNYKIRERTMVRYTVKRFVPDKFNLYYALLDIQPDDKINILTSSESPSSYMIQGGQPEAELRNSFIISPPFGREHLILITSRTPIQTSFIAGIRHVSDQFALLFDALNKGNSEFITRGDPPSKKSFDLSDVFIDVIEFEIKK